MAGQVLADAAAEFAGQDAVFARLGAFEFNLSH